MASVLPVFTRTGHSDYVLCVTFAPDDTLASGSEDETIIGLDVTSGEAKWALTGHSGPVSCLTICEDVLVSGSGDKTIRRWNLETGEQIGSPLTGHEGTRPLALYLAEKKVPNLNQR